MRQAFPMVRDLRALRTGRFDLLVVGGGIYGAWTAYDAALRGLRVALIERDDWASGTSSASSKLIHGGLRYLEHYDFGLVREALNERRTLSRIAPHLVRPRRFVLPLWKDSRLSLLKLRAGLALYDWLAGRNQPVGRHRFRSAAQLLVDHRYVRSEQLRGALDYGDCQQDDARLTLYVVAAARSAGAVIANCVAAESWIDDGRGDGGVGGAVLRDRQSGESFRLKADAVVLAAGPWAPELLGTQAPQLKRVRGVHLVLPAMPDADEAFLLTAPQDGRVFFVIPWYGRSLVGTTESLLDHADAGPVTAEEQKYLLDAVRHSLPGLRWNEADVLASFAGVRSLQAKDTADLAAVTREFALLTPRPRLLMPLGGKYTTARRDAQTIVDRVLQTLGREPVGCATQMKPLPGAPPAEFRGWSTAAVRRLKLRGVDAEAALWLVHRHGTRVDRLLRLLIEDPALARRLHPTLGFIRAEVLLAVREEMALSLADVLRRRVPLALLAPPDAAILEDVAAIMGAELGWDDACRAQAVEGYLQTLQGR